MTNCIRCKEPLEEGVNFCPKCGQEQNLANQDKRTSSNSFLTILCILTIVGSVFTMGRGLLYEVFSSLGKGDSSYYRGWIYFFTSIGTIVGAIIMINRKKIGLIIYSISNIAYIFTAIYAALYISSQTWSGLSPFALAIAMFFVIPSSVFTILYWLPSNRSLLR